MGNYMSAALARDTEENNGDDTILKSPMADLKDISDQLQTLLGSAEHQIRSALLLVDSTDIANKSLPKRASNNKQKRILKEQLHGLRKTLHAMSSLVQSVLDDNTSRGDETQISTLTTEIRFYQRTVEDLKEEILSLQEENKTLKLQSTASSSDYVEDMECQISELVQIVPSKLKDRRIVEEFVCHLKSTFERIHHSSNVQVVENIKDIRSDQLVMVIFVKASRLEVDAASALEGIKLTPLTRRAGLVVLHLKEIHDAAIQPSEKLLSKDFRKKIPGKIFDMAFTAKKGIYECEMNKRTLQDIANFIKATGTCA